jgi:ABC-type molybdate transport system substrate-binding protein
MINYSYLKIGIIVSFTLAVAAVVMRAIWQIVVIPTAGTMVIFIPLIFTLLGADAIVVYFVLKPSLQKLRNLPVVIAITVVLTAGLVAGVSHFAHFIPSPEAAPLLSKTIGAFVLLSSLTAYLLLLWLIWSFWKGRKK